MGVGLGSQRTIFWKIFGKELNPKILHPWYPKTLRLIFEAGESSVIPPFLTKETIHFILVAIYIRV